MSPKSRNIQHHLRRQCAVALLTAITVVMALVCKNFTIAPFLRITFENMPLILTGYAFGPWAGLFAGAVADFLNTMVTYGFGQWNPLITLGAGLVGFAAGALARWVWPRRGTVCLLLSTVAGHLVGNILMKSLAFWVYFRTPLPLLLLRAAVCATCGVVEFFLLYALLRNRGVTKLLGGVTYDDL